MISSDSSIELQLEYEIPTAVNAQLADLLDLCFPGTFEGRTYYKQLPHFRLIYRQGSSLIGQLGVDSRIINVSGEIFAIFGVIDLCVHPSHRSKGIAAALLSRLEEIAGSHQRDFLVLMAERHELYLKQHFMRVIPAATRWLAIDERSSFSLMERDLGDCFMIKALSGRSWPEGSIDILGYLF